VFAHDFTQAVQCGEKQEEKALDMFSSSGEKYGWVASVKIPRCAPDISRRRADEIIEAAINLLKIFYQLSTTQFNYPYTLREGLTGKPTDHNWRAVFLENEYLKCSALPDLGGHIYTCIDKISRQPMSRTGK
jgi:hypothetical protein